MSMRRAILVFTSLAAVVVSGQTTLWRYLTSSDARPRPFNSRRYMAQPTVGNVARTNASGDPPTPRGSRWSMSPAEQRAFNDASRERTSDTAPPRAWIIAEGAYLLHRYPPYAD
jgi:hypothetical protein